MIVALNEAIIELLSGCRADAAVNYILEAEDWIQRIGALKRVGREELLPGKPLVSEIPADEELIPHATHELMLSGRFPLIRVPEGKLSRVKAPVVTALADLLTVSGLTDADKWDDAFSTCKRNGSELYVMDPRGERWLVKDVYSYPHSKDGEIRLLHLGRQGRIGQTHMVNVRDFFGRMVPFVVVK